MRLDPRSTTALNLSKSAKLSINEATQALQEPDRLETNIVTHCLTQTIKFIRLKGNSGKIGKKEEIFKKMIGKKGL